MDKVQQKNIQNLLKLIRENPYLRIVPLVDTKCVPGDEFNSWVASWGQSRIDEICESFNKERIYIKSEDYDDLVDDVMCLWVETEEEARKCVDGYAWEKVIIVEINMP